MHREQDREMDQRIREKLEQLECKVPQGLWEGISQALDATARPEAPIKQISARSVKERRRGMRPAWLSAAALLPLAICLWLWQGDQEVIYLTARQPAAETAVSPEKSSPSSVPAAPSGTGPSSYSSQEQLVENPVTRKQPRRLAASGKTEGSRPGSGRTGDLQENPFQERLPAALAGNLRVSAAPIGENLAEELLFREPEAGMKKNLSGLQAAREQAPAPAAKLGQGGVSLLLNLLAKGLNETPAAGIEFSTSEEGILQLDVSKSLVKVFSK